MVLRRDAALVARQIAISSELVRLQTPAIAPGLRR